MQALDNLLNRCDSFEKKCLDCGIFEYEDEKTLNWVREYLGNIKKEMKTYEDQILKMPAIKKILNDCSNILDEMEAKLSIKKQARCLGSEYTVVYEMMDRNDEEFYVVCTGPHLDLIKAIQEKYKDKIESIRYFNQNHPRRISTIGTESLNDLNFELHTNYTKEFLKALFKIMHYEFYSPQLAVAIGSNWDNALAKLRDTPFYNKELESTRLHQDLSIYTFPRFGLNILRFLRFRGDGSKEHWPYIPIQDEIIRYGEGFNITDNLLNKLNMIGTSTYKGYTIPTVFELASIRLGLKQFIDSVIENEKENEAITDDIVFKPLGNGYWKLGIGIFIYR